MADPENIDVSLTLADETALQSFIDAVNNLSAALSTMGTQGTSGGTQGGGNVVQSGAKTGPDQPTKSTTMTDSGVRSSESPSQSQLFPEESNVPQWMQTLANRAPDRVGRILASGASPYRQAGEILGDLGEGEYMEAYGGVQLASQLYGGMAHRFVPAPFDPMSANQIGQGWGLPGSSTTIGIPGTDIGIMSPFGPAGKEYYGNVFDAFQATLAPGQSGVGAWEAMNAQEELGWHGDKQDQMYRAYQDIIGNNESRFGDKGLTMNMMDQAVRLGQTSLEDFVSTMKEIPDTAQAANISVDEFKQQVDQVANGLQAQGLTYGQGMRAATRFSGATNLSPLIGEQLMGNQYIQANMMGRYGLFPQQQGLLFQNTGAFMNTAMDTISQMRGLYQGSFQSQEINLGKYGTTTITGKDKTDAMVAQAMGLQSVDELRRLERDSKRSTKQGLIGDMATEYNRSVAQIHKLDDRNPARAAMLMDQLKAGTGPYAGKNAISWNDMLDIMGQKHSGFNQGFIDKLSGMGAQERSAAILHHIKKKGGSDTVGKPTIDLTPAAKKLVKFLEDQGVDLTLDQERAIAQSGVGRINDSYTGNSAVKPNTIGPTPENYDSTKGIDPYLLG